MTLWEKAAKGTMWERKEEQRSFPWWPFGLWVWAPAATVCDSDQETSIIAIWVPEMLPFEFFNKVHGNVIHLISYISWIGQLLFCFCFDNETWKRIWFSPWVVAVECTCGFRLGRVWWLRIGQEMLATHISGQQANSMWKVWAFGNFSEEGTHWFPSLDSNVFSQSEKIIPLMLS